MNFLEAKKILAQPVSGRAMRVRLSMSGATGSLPLYLGAHARKRGVDLAVEELPFGTLAGDLAVGRSGDTAEILLLMPWDLAPELDWRSGVPAREPAEVDLLRAAESTTERVGTRGCAVVAYLDAPLPPVLNNHHRVAALRERLRALASSVGAVVLPADAFALGAYFIGGCPVSGQHAADVAATLARALICTTSGVHKVLVTDLDETLWGGLVAEDGPETVSYLPEGKGFRHFLYQTLLARLKASGVLLAAVSRNDAEVVKGPFARGDMTLGWDDFVHVSASYEAKSAQIRQMAEALNLGLDAFVFVDDNPVELEEVTRSLPSVTTLQFPCGDDNMVEFLDQLAGLFSREALSGEDATRTELYRRRLDGLAPAHLAGADLHEFLRGLSMRLVVRDRTRTDRTRAVQLINKTNQFNLNGGRLDDSEVEEQLAAGGRLFTGELHDRSGTHGEVLACLLGPDGGVTSMVMSCRVFQRRLEFAFVSHLLALRGEPLRFKYVATPRNEPFLRFLKDAACSWDGDLAIASPETFVAAHAADSALFSIEGP